MFEDVDKTLVEVVLAAPAAPWLLTELEVGPDKLAVVLCEFVLGDGALVPAEPFPFGAL